MKKQIKKDSCIVFLPTVIIENYLHKLQKADFDIFHAGLQKRDNLLPIKLYWNKFFF